MTPCFADTFYYLALLNPRDPAHERTRDLSLALNRPTITTAWVLTEIADGLATTPARALFDVLLQNLRSDSDATIIAATEDLFEKGVDLYVRRPDKEWSLTDCISFVVMRQLNIEDALTADHHFEQAGFRILL